MALDSAIIWEVRTTGAQTGGGGFKAGATGTDYSQQDAAQDNGTDLECADGDAASPVITSASHNFVAADVGNIVHITAGTGWTVGWYEIVSVADNAATMDRAVGTDGAKTSGTWYLGGAFNFGNTSTDSEFFAANQKKTGNTIYIKSGDYTLSENIASGVAGAAATIKILGYETTRGDEPTGTSRPLIDCGSYYFAIAADYSIRNLSFTGSNGNYVVYPSSECYFFNCKFVNTTGTYACTSASTRNKYFGCEFVATAGTGANAGGDAAVFAFCYFHDSVAGLLNNDYTTIVGCVFDTCTTGITATGFSGSIIINNTIYNCTTGINGGMSSLHVLLNNIIIGSTTGLSSTATNKQSFLDHNLWYNNTTDISANTFSKGNNAVSTDPEMAAPASADFTIGSESPASATGLDASTYTDVTV